MRFDNATNFNRKIRVSVRFASMLNAKFAQFRRTRDAGTVGERKRRASLFEHGNHNRHTLLFLNSKTVPPCFKVISDDDLGGQSTSIPYQDYSVKGLSSLGLFKANETLSPSLPSVSNGRGLGQRFRGQRSGSRAAARDEGELLNLPQWVCCRRITHGLSAAAPWRCAPTRVRCGGRFACRKSERGGAGERRRDRPCGRDGRR
jgi:hypothetical protein